MDILEAVTREGGSDGGAAVSYSNPMAGAMTVGAAAAATGISTQQKGEDAAAETTQVCPNLAEALDSAMTNPDGSPTLWFRTAIVGAALQGVVILCGIPILPSIVDAFELGDPLGMLAVVVAATIPSFANIMRMVESRRVCRTHADAPLIKLGAGTALISKTAMERIDWARKTYGGGSAVLMLLWVAPIGAIVVAVVISGWGIHTPLHNSISMVALFLCYVPGTKFAYPWHMTLLMATTLAAQQVEEVHANVRRRPSPKDWEATVARPATQLVSVMQVLSTGWGPGMLIFAFHLTLLSMFFVLLALAPVRQYSMGLRAEHPQLTFSHLLVGCQMVDTYAAKAGADWVPDFIRVCAVFFAVSIPQDIIKLAHNPATISTACDDLAEELNAIRMENLSSAETDLRLSTLVCLTSTFSLATYFLIQI